MDIIMQVIKIYNDSYIKKKRDKNHYVKKCLLQLKTKS